MPDTTITFPPRPQPTVTEDGQPVYPASTDPGFTAGAAYNMLSNAVLVSGLRPPDPGDPAQWIEMGDLVNKLRALSEGGPPGGYGGNSTLERNGGTLTVTERQLDTLRAAWLAWLPSATVAQAAEVLWMNTALGLTPS